MNGPDLHERRQRKMMAAWHEQVEEDSNAKTGDENNTGANA